MFLHPVCENLQMHLRVPLPGLTEVNVSNICDQEDLNSRVRAAAFIGTLQASSLAGGRRYA